MSEGNERKTKRPAKAKVQAACSPRAGATAGLVPAASVDTETKFHGCGEVGAATPELAARLMRQVHALGVRGGGGTEAVSCLKEFRAGIRDSGNACGSDDRHARGGYGIPRFAFHADPETDEIKANVEQALSFLGIFIEQLDAIARLKGMSPQ